MASDTVARRLPTRVFQGKRRKDVVDVLPGNYAYGHGWQVLWEFHQDFSLHCCEALGGTSQDGAGLNSASTDLCHIQVTQVFSVAKVFGVSCGVVFVDLVSAFASVSRRLAIPDMPESEEEWMRHLASICHSPDVAAHIVGSAPTVLRLNYAGATAHSIALLRETHGKNWYSTDGLRGICEFLCGTLAGTSLADIVFIFVCVARVTTKINGGLKVLGRVHQFCSADAAVAFGMDPDYLPHMVDSLSPMWVDDLAIPVLKAADTLFDSAAEVMACVWNNFLDYQMECNMWPGKTAFLPRITGRGSGVVKRRVAKFVDGAILLPGAISSGPVHLKGVSLYVHMGRHLTSTGSQHPEITARHASTRPYVDRLTFGFFKKTSTTVEKKLTVAASLLLSKELYCVAASPVLKANE